MKIKQQLCRNPMQQTGSTTRTILASVGILTIILIVSTTLFLKNQNDDAFNYANENASQLTENRDQWSSIEWLESIELILDQSQAVIYWQSNSELSWKCINKDGIDQGPTGEIVNTP